MALYRPPFFPNCITATPPDELLSISNHIRLVDLVAAAPAVRSSEPERDIVYGELVSVDIPLVGAISISNDIEPAPVVVFAD